MTKFNKENKLMLFLVIYFSLEILFLFVSNNLLDSNITIYTLVIYAFKALTIIIFYYFIIDQLKIKYFMFSTFMNKFMVFWIIIGFLSFFIGLVYNNPIQYIVGDTIGWIIIPILFIYTFNLLKQKRISLIKILELYKIFTVIIGLVYIVKYILASYGIIPTKYMGVGTYYLGLSYLMFLVFVHSNNFKNVNNKLNILLLMVSLFGLVISFRRTVVLAALCGLLLLLVIFFRKLNIKNFFLVAFILICLSIFILPGEEISSRFVNIFSENSSTGFGDSAEYRLLEIQGQYQHFQNFGNVLNYIVGFGNGAMYKINNITTHQGHFVYSIVFFRSGILGLLCLMSVLTYSLISLISRKSNEITKIAVVALLMIYIDFITAQYLYFSIHLPVTIALIEFSKKTSFKKLVTTN